MAAIPECGVGEGGAVSLPLYARSHGIPCVKSLTGRGPRGVEDCHFDLLTFPVTLYHENGYERRWRKHPYIPI